MSLLFGNSIDKLSLCVSFLFVSLLLVSGSAFAQNGWNYGPAPLEPLPAEAAWSPWPQVAQTPNVPMVASNTSCGCNSGNPAVYGSPNDNACGTNSPNYYESGNPAASCQSSPPGYTANTYPRAGSSSLWYASAAGLMMGRDKARRVWTSYETNNNANQLMNTQAVDSNWRGGMEFHLGRKICCGTWAVDLGYWALEDFDATSSQTHANSVSSPLLFNDLEFGLGGVPVADYFDSAMEHRLSRRNRIQNLEVNLIESGQACSTGCSPWSCQKILGLRYFRFDEDLVFQSLDQGGTWGGNGGLDEATLDNSIENHLLGAQLGCQWLRQVGCRGSFFITPKFGVYNNRINNRFDLRRGDGTAAVPSAFSNVAGSYPVETSTDEISFLSELNIGLAWRPTNRWSIFGGYRVVVLSGIGTADSQIPQYIVDIPEIAAIDHEDTLVLQGVFAGVSYSL